MWRALLLVLASAGCDFKRVRPERLREGFEERQEEPLVISGPRGHANASREAFRRLLGASKVAVTRNLEFQSRSGSKPEAVATTFGAWLEQLETSEAVPYIFEFCTAELCSLLEESYEVPGYLKGLSSVLYLAAGKVAKGVAFHQHWQTWGRLLAGQKQWYVAPPGHTPLRPHRYREESELMKLVGRGELLQCLQEEGEIVFLPRDWWHATYNKANWTLALGGQGVGYAQRVLDKEALEKMSEEVGAP